MKVDQITFILTTLSGIIVFIIGQFLSKFYIEPAQELLKCIGKVESMLIFYANIYSNYGFTDKNLLNDAKRNIRNLSSELVSKANVVRGYSLFEFIGYIPSKENIIKAATELMGLSNSLNDRESISENIKSKKTIRTSLKLGAEGEILERGKDKFLISLFILLTISVLIILLIA
ncbi:hypothetical protein ACLD43_17505 [Clostridium botulinum]|uniref:hypothetical protein n=1 Tax=Clostridium botulinum TaxID=1491 RepID=UPI003A7FF28F